MTKQYSSHGSKPESPQTSVLKMGGTSWKPNSSRSTERCLAVNGCVHILVFIAGHTISGRVKSHALAIHVYETHMVTAL